MGEFCFTSIRKNVCIFVLKTLPFFLRSHKVIEKFTSPSLNPANQLLLSIGDKSKSKQSIELLSFSFIQHIALCNASILGVRI
jgi:hypothetical protein